MYVGAGFVSAGLRLYVRVPLIVDMFTSVLVQERERECALARVLGGRRRLWEGETSIIRITMTL